MSSDRYFKRAAAAATTLRLPDPTARQQKQAWEKFVEKQEKRAAKRALVEERKKQDGLSDSEKIAHARAHREKMHLARIEAERKKRERVYFIGSVDVRKLDGPVTTEDPEYRTWRTREPEVVEITGALSGGSG